MRGRPRVIQDLIEAHGWRNLAASATGGLRLECVFNASLMSK
jgi:hypothetical protein